MKAKKLLTKSLFVILFCFAVSESFAQRQIPMKELVNNFDRVETSAIYFLMGEVNQLKNDSIFFARYKRNLKELKDDKKRILYQLHINKLNFIIDTILASKSNLWNKPRFERLKKVTPKSEVINFNWNGIKEIILYTTDETDAENALFFLLFLYDAEALLQICQSHPETKRDLNNWEYEYYPFADCYFKAYYPELIERKRKFVLEKYKNTKNEQLLRILDKIKKQKPSNC